MAFTHKKGSDSFDPRQASVKTTDLVTLNVQKLIQDRAENVRRSIVIGSVLEVSVVAILVPAVRAVLIAALKSLTEVILILPAIDAVLIAVGAGAIDVRVRPARAPVATVVRASGSESLTIAFVDRLP